MADLSVAELATLHAIVEEQQAKWVVPQPVPVPEPWDDYEDEPWDVTDMPGIGSEPPLAQPDPAEPDLAQPDPAEPDIEERSLDCMRRRSEDAQRQARQEAGG